MTSSTCSYEGCTRPVHNKDEGKCIFHAKEKDPQEFRDALADQIRVWRKEKATVWNFRGWVFVDVQRKDKYPLKKSNLFRRAVFPVGADFYSAKFSGKASFCSAAFSGTAYFYLTTFSGDADFSSVTFSGIAYFHSATFSGTAYFESATFCSMLNMAYTSFSILGDFTNTTIGGDVWLMWPGVGQERKRGRLLLQGLKFEKKGEEEPLLNLRGNALQEDCKLLIRDTKMKKILLEGTDCRLIEFHNVSWGKYKEKLHAKRQIVGDEHYLRNEPSVFGKNIPSWNKIEETYQQLADRFRKDLKHPAANDFERGIFEARLMAAKQKNEEGKRDWHNRFLLGAYKFASDFSGSIFRPVFWTLLLTVIAAVVYGWLLYDGFSNVTWWPDFGKVLKSAVAALRVASLDRGWFSSAVDGSLPPVSDFVRFILSLTAIIQTLLTAILITLFIFSVRRRFKHTE